MIYLPSSCHLLSLWLHTFASCTFLSLSVSLTLPRWLSSSINDRGLSGCHDSIDGNHWDLMNGGVWTCRTSRLVAVRTRWESRARSPLQTQIKYTQTYVICFTMDALTAPEIKLVCRNPRTDILTGKDEVSMFVFHPSVLCCIFIAQLTLSVFKATTPKLPYWTFPRSQHFQILTSLISVHCNYVVVSMRKRLPLWRFIIKFWLGLSNKTHKNEYSTVLAFHCRPSFIFHTALSLAEMWCIQHCGKLTSF